MKLLRCHDFNQERPDTTDDQRRVRDLYEQNLQSSVERRRRVDIRYLANMLIADVPIGEW